MKKNPLLWVVLLGTYLFFQFLWWGKLILQLYDNELDMKLRLGNLSEIEAKEILAHKQAMIIGEGLVFFVLVFIGLYLIYRSTKREIQVAKLQKNFFLSITHELKTPLAGMKLFLQTLLKRELPEEKKKEILQKTLNENDRLEKLIERVLFTKTLDAKTVDINKQSNLLANTLNNTIERLESSISQEIKAEFAADISFPHDSVIIDMLLGNLLENAAKYSPPESNITVSLTQSISTINISVSDEGDGIPLKERKKIFGKFYRIGSEMTRNAKGTGLGLYIVKTLVELHNGIVSYEEKQGKGSTFVLQFKTTK